MVKLFWPCIKYCDIKMVSGVEVQLHAFLTLALKGEVSFTPKLFKPLRRNPRYPLDGRLHAPQGRSDPCGEKKNLLALPGIEP
jgi:hypothetical protein